MIEEDEKTRTYIFKRREKIGKKKRKKKGGKRWEWKAGEGGGEGLVEVLSMTILYVAGSESIIRA